MALPVPVSIGERLWGIPWEIPQDFSDLVDSWLIPTVFHVLINGRVAHPNRAWSRDRVRSRVRIWSCAGSREARTGEGSRGRSHATFPRSCAFFSGSRGGIFAFTIWL